MDFFSYHFFSVGKVLPKKKKIRIHLNNWKSIRPWTKLPQCCVWRERKCSERYSCVSECGTVAFSRCEKLFLFYFNISEMSVLASLWKWDNVLIDVLLYGLYVYLMPPTRKWAAWHRSPTRFYAPSLPSFKRLFLTFPLHSHRAPYTPAPVWSACALSHTSSHSYSHITIAVALRWSWFNIFQITNSVNSCYLSINWKAEMNAFLLWQSHLLKH